MESQGAEAQSQWEQGPGLKIQPFSLAPHPHPTGNIPAQQALWAHSRMLVSTLPALGLGNQGSS